MSHKVKFYIICGFLGAGKTTFSKQLAREKNALHLNPDEWCCKLFTPEEYENKWGDCFQKTVDFLWQKAQEAVIGRRDIVFDMGFWSKASRLETKKRAEQLGTESVLYYIYAPDEILKQRISLRKGKIAENNIKNFYSIKKLFEEPENDENFIKINNF